jgi:hypothetical protein
MSAQWPMMNMTVPHKWHHKSYVNPTGTLRDCQKPSRTMHCSEHLSVAIKHAIKTHNFTHP